MQINTKLLILFILTVGVINLLLSANAITAEFMEGQFEPVMDIGNVTKIEAWEQPRTQYTPKNLKSEYQVRYSGTNASGKGAYSYTTHFTDYDTYITKNGITTDGQHYYIQDNTGKGWVTGDKVDLTPVNNQINNINTNVETINKDINTLHYQMNSTNGQLSSLKREVDYNSYRINKLNDKIESGLATVTALTGLHPNPRSNEKLEVALSAGMYADNVAGAIGLFYHPNDRVIFSAGASYGGDSNFAGNVGITFGIGRKNK